jgi:hypothetical protein
MLSLQLLLLLPHHLTCPLTPACLRLLLRLLMCRVILQPSVR